MSLIGTISFFSLDDETLNNNTVTIRDRDTMEQIKLDVSEVVKFVEDKIKF